MQNKKILFISPVFYDYHLLIIDGLIKLGAQVHFYPERSYSIMFTIINNLFPYLINLFQKRHYQNILNHTKDTKFDYLFINRGYKIDEHFIKEFKNRNPNSTLLMNQWDSNKNNIYSHLVPLFDKTYSFDFLDSENIPKVIYLPNFYTANSYLLESSSINNELLFLGVYNFERYQFIKNVYDYCNKNSLKTDIKLFIPYKFYIKELLRFRKLDHNLLTFHLLDRKEYLEKLYQSKIVLDVSSGNQTGYSQRIIEALYCKKMILTTNTYLKKNLNDNPNIFLTDELEIIKNKNYNTNYDYNILIYSIENWIKTIFSELD